MIYLGKMDRTPCIGSYCKLSGSSDGSTIIKLCACGTLQVLNQSTSIDGLKKSEGYPGTLRGHFSVMFGLEDGADFKAAQRRFCCSLAG